MSELNTAIIGTLNETLVKSMRSRDNVDSINIDNRGMFNDREYMVVEAMPHKNINHEKGYVAEAGHFLSQREDPILATIIPSLDSNGIKLEHSNVSIDVKRTVDSIKNRRQVMNFDWRGEAVDQGDEAAEWLSEIIGRAVRLVANSDEKPRYVENIKSLGRLGFSDGYPITIASTRSYELLNQSLESSGHDAVPQNRTRTNIVLDKVELPRSFSKDAFPEDYIKRVYISHEGLELILKRRKACARCPIPDTDQVTGSRKGRPILAALNNLGRHGYHLDKVRYGDKPGVFFSQNYIIEMPINMPKDSVIKIAKDSLVIVEFVDQTNWIMK